MSTIVYDPHNRNILVEYNEQDVQYPPDTTFVVLRFQAPNLLPEESIAEHYWYDTTDSAIKPRLLEDYDPRGALLFNVNTKIAALGGQTLNPVKEILQGLISYVTWPIE